MFGERRSDGSEHGREALEQAVQMVRRLTVLSVMIVVVLGSALLWTAGQVAQQIDANALEDDRARLTRALDASGADTPLSAEYVLNLAGLTGMQSPRIAPDALAMRPNEAAMAVTPEMTLLWTPQRPGARLFNTFAPIRVPMIVLMAFGLLGVIIYLNRLARRLDAQRRDAVAQAAADSLTGLSNRLGFDTALAARFNHAPRPTTLFYLDLDGFKAVNDIFGHAAGDNILRSIGARLRIQFPDALAVARIGGDEFAVVLEGADTPRNIKRARRARGMLRVPHQSGGRHTEVGISIGIAEAPKHGLTPKTLVAMADAALYRAKSQRTGVSLALDAQPGDADDYSGPRQKSADPAGKWVDIRSIPAASK